VSNLWLKMAAAGFCAAMLVGLVSTTSAPNVSAAARPPDKASLTVRSSTVNDSDVNPASWMHDLAPYIEDRTLTDIVIPGSHDSATYGLPAPDDDLWHSQNEDLTAQLNDGIREFDVRVEYHNGDFYAHHGSGSTDGISHWLTLERIFSDIGDWATASGHDHEIILLALGISGGMPTSDCQSFGQTLGDALVTPNLLQAQFGTTDPGQVKISDLWSLPDPKGYARVIMDNTQCLDAADPSAGQWSNAITGGLFGGYYADQCSYSGISVPEGDQYIGLHDAVLTAVKTRALGPGNRPDGWNGGTFTAPPKVGGLYVLGIQGTPEFGCLYSPWDMVSAERQVLTALYQQWQTDPGTKANLNVVSGDFVQNTDLYKDVIAMDESLPVEASLTKVAPSADPVRLQLQTEVGGFSVRLASSSGLPLSGQEVTFEILPAESYEGQWVTPYFAGAGRGGGAQPTSIVSTDSSGVALSDKIDGAESSGQFWLTASTPLVKDPIVWFLDIGK
jgi:hypothetical protein